MKPKKFTRQRCAELFRAYWNDFLTVPRFAEYYEIDHATALRVIAIGRKAHNQEAEKFKQEAQQCKTNS